MSEPRKAKPGDIIEVTEEPFLGEKFTVVECPDEYKNGQHANEIWVTSDGRSVFINKTNACKIIKRGGKQLISACVDVDEHLRDQQTAHFRKVLGEDDWEKEGEKVDSGPKPCRWCKGTKILLMAIPGSTKPCLECVGSPTVPQHEEGEIQEHSKESGLKNAWYSQENDKKNGSVIYRLAKSGKEVRVSYVTRSTISNFNWEDSVFVGVVDKYIRQGDRL